LFGESEDLALIDATELEITSEVLLIEGLQTRVEETTQKRV